MSADGLESTPQRVFLGLVLGIGCIVGGVYLTYDSYEATVNAEATDAVVLDSHVSGVSGAERKFRVHVTYEYTYEGEVYTSDNVYAGAGGNDRFSVRGNAESFIADYPEGETVTAHVNPDDPAEAHLESGIRIKLLGAYAILILIGIVTTAGGLKHLLSLVGVTE
jgi:hypothetical protein